MKTIICDSNLIHRSGHFSVWNKFLVDIALEQEEETFLVSHKSLPGENLWGGTLVKHFQHTIMHDSAEQDNARILNTYLGFNQVFLNDMKKLPATWFEKETRVIFSNLSYNQLDGAVRWVGSFEEGKRPHVIFFLHEPSGCYFNEASGEFLVNHAHSAKFHQHFLKMARDVGAEIYTCGETLAKQYSHLGGREILPHPLINSAIQAPLEMNQKKNFAQVLMFAGVPDISKGFGLIPDAVCDLTSRWPKIKFAAHADKRRLSGENEAIFGELSALRQEHQNFLFNTLLLDQAQYADAFFYSSVVVAPYIGENYVYQTSGVVWEAIATANRLVVPKETWLEKEVQEIGADYVVFDKADGAFGVADAVSRALTGLDITLQQRIECAQKFRAKQNRRHMIEILKRPIYELAR
ncbi:glycosyltransferase [Kordiimonas sp. SCSIO 12603]|uniref:hypothetical protein n=1 Tax=Kordiimonas sp. SCSIO 12603 TaxID=2829596 RepID=UPI00210538C3|nr:hypothetical protein [Kordiimonas sp. SCSIO 12603]UTW59685.1 glycosyltransferase [Kordiimonas sp. SCSIO 12603]